MKPGDLVKLVLPGNYVGWHGKVVVSWVNPVVELRAVSDHEPPAPSRFPEGTLAVFLSDASSKPRPLVRRSHHRRILIEGRVGWVRSVYLEAL